MTFSIATAKGTNCLDNINHALGERRSIITSVNLFMHTKINVDGSVSESRCNSGKCSPVKIMID